MYVKKICVRVCSSMLCEVVQGINTRIHTSFPYLPLPSESPRSTLFDLIDYIIIILISDIILSRVIIFLITY